MTKATSHTGSEGSKELVQKWRHECLDTHENCQLARRNGYFPTRVLNLGTMEAPKLELYVNNEGAPTSPYAALSHCWGEIPIQRLLCHNLTSLTNRISFGELPKTFQEAIIFSRYLGIQYLWIDSLCILQDSVADWQHQAAQMEMVYKNAILTIAATAASDSNGGCFMDRNPLNAQVCRVRVRSLPGSFYKKGTDLYDVGAFGFLSGDPVIHAPLNTRAWVLQEQYLSSRTIHCTRNQLLWECRELVGIFSLIFSHPSCPYSPYSNCVDSNI